MDNLIPVPRFTVWRILGEMVYLSVTMFFLQRAIEELGLWEVVFQLYAMFVFYLYIRWLSFPAIVFLNGLWQWFINPLAE